MIRNLALLLVLLAWVAAPEKAAAQATVRPCITQSSGPCLPVSATNPLPISGSFSAATFLPTPAYATPISVSTTSASVALPTGGTAVLYNKGSIAAYCTVGSGSATATTSHDQVAPGGFFTYATTGYDTVACITASSTTTVNVSGGSGTPSGSGGGGGSGGGAVTLASGAVSSGAYSSGSIASGAFASGSIASGAMVDLGAIADAAATAGSTGTLSAKLRLMTTQLDNINTSAGTIATNTGAAIPAGTASIGNLNPCTSITPVVAAASDNHAVLKNGAGVACSIHTTNNSATKNYLRLYDAGTGFNGCNSATNAIFAMEIPPNDSGFSVALGGGNGISFTNGLSWCITSGFGLTDTTNATASAIYANASYR